MEEDRRGVRRRHSAELKQRILAACDEPGASVARIALAHGINANIVHKWRRQCRSTNGGGASAQRSVVSEPFVPVTFAAAAPGSMADIRIELRRGAAVVSVHWPTGAAAECAAWLRDWLK
jgi:transposase